jgi:putative ABC transport system permease protein
MTGLWQDVRFATRMFTKRRAFTAAAVLTLALGIGASTATFNVVNGVLLKPLPFHDAEQLVSVSHRGVMANGSGQWNHGPVTWFAAHDHEQRALEALGAWDRKEVAITGRGDPEHVHALAVSHATLSLLRVQPMLGRFFLAEDDTPESPLRVVLAHGYWQRKFGGATNVIGQTLEVDGVSAEIVGVLPQSFIFLRLNPSIVFPLRVNRAETGIQFGFQALGRLKPGVTLEQANADMARWLATLPPHYDRLELRPNIRPLAEHLIEGVSRVLWILLGVAGVVLLIACANVANLFLVRAEGRQQEFALRAALGASGGRIARALLAESVLLALAGGAVGLLLTQAAIRLLQWLAPARLPRVAELSIDPTVLAFAIAVALLGGVLFGLVAVVKFAGPDSAALKESGRSASASPGRHRTRNSLVVAQIALALMLLVVSGLMVRSFVALREVNPGWTRAEEVQTFRVAIPSRLIENAEPVVRAHQAIAERVAQVAGVASVGLSSSITMDGEDNMNYIQIEGADNKDRPLRRFKSFAPGYFATMGIRLAAGREVTWAEIYERRPVVVISQALAREYWPDPTSALGKRLWSGNDDEVWREIVGVAADERDDGLNQPATPIVYWPMLNESYQWRAMSYAVRSSRVGTPGFIRELQQAVWSVNAALPLSAIETLDEIRARSMSQTSFAMVMLAISASVALVLGVIGIYSVIAYVAVQRTREIGIRIALGAQLRDVRSLFLRHGFRLSALGIGVGTVGAMLTTRVMSSLLFGVARTDPVTYIGVALGLGLVALLATYLPARRASRVDPVIALRGES